MPRCSKLVFGRAKNMHISATVLDSSNYAVTTAAEDITMRQARANQDLLAKQNAMSLDSDKHSPFKIPGQRARFFAAGTRTGQIFVWDARAAVLSSANLESQVEPLRIIQTDSAEISCLALSALYLVHGGSEGLVQAWDPLGSTLQPVRTICSPLTRRARLAAQQDPNVPSRQLSAVGAIRLDPDPTVLRGIVAMRGKFRLWGYSSSTATNFDSKIAEKKVAPHCSRTELVARRWFYEW